ncbi:MAG: hypothetical protein LC754_06055 [Acidobacteria bacterium]|nr:hypothetical protein [Acidobacteriota bacterium]
MNDPVREFCRQKGYADFVIAGGLDYLIPTWERIVDSVVKGEPQCQDGYLKDMDTRQIIAEVLPIASESQRATILDRLEVADERMHAAVVRTQECIWGEENAEKYGWNREEQWWYFTRSKNVESDWRTF